MMTRKDYVSTAKILNDSLNGIIDNETDFIDAFIEMFKADNPNFNEEIFLKAVHA
jgi:hypothetical protein